MGLAAVRDRLCFGLSCSLILLSLRASPGAGLFGSNVRFRPKEDVPVTQIIALKRSLRSLMPPERRSGNYATADSDLISAAIVNASYSNVRGMQI